MKIAVIGGGPGGYVAAIKARSKPFVFYAVFTMQ